MEYGASGQSPLDADKHETGKIYIELTPSQVDEVITKAGETGSVSALLSGLTDIPDLLTRTPQLLENPEGSRALMVGMLMIGSMPSDGSYIKAAALARALKMSRSTADRYLTTLMALGMVEQDPVTRRYKRAV